MHGGRIFYYDVTKNWWSRAGVPDNMPTGEPGGADSEMFYKFTDIKHNKKFGEHCHPNCDCGRFLEIGNSVFMEYIKNEDGSFSKLPQHNVDFGGGLERITMAKNDCSDIIKINHKSILDYLEKVSNKKYGQNDNETRAFRIIADHMKAAVFLIIDGINPSNTNQGYFVRRLIRRSIIYADSLGITDNVFSGIVQPIAYMYKDTYPEVSEKILILEKVINEEEVKFRETLAKGLKKIQGLFKKVGNLDTFDLNGDILFDLYQTFGFPIELSLEEIDKERVNRGKQVIGEELRKTYLDGFNKKMTEHQKLSQTASVGMFKGGLANHNEKTIKLHTAHHLLLAGLQAIVSPTVKQKGSNITEERLRIDFLCDHKLTDEEKQKVEDWVNDKIKQGLNVIRREMPLAEAEKIGAEMEFGAKYPEIVSVYFIENKNGDIISKEFCGGPHVENTKELGVFKIKKEEAVSAGVRRIKAILL
jgi:alanyl-tRNA synthetase